MCIRDRRAGAEGDAHGPHLADDLVPDAHELVEIGPLLRGGADRLDDEEVAGDAAPADRPGRVLDRHVVVDEEGLDPQALGLAQLAAHLERGPVAVSYTHLRAHETVL